MAQFYAIVKKENNKSAVVELQSTIYHQALNEAEDLCKKGSMTVELVRPFANGRNQPGILSKGNIRREEQGNYSKNE